MTFLFYHLQIPLICIVSSFFLHTERISIFIAKPANLTGVYVLLNILLSFHSLADHGTAELAVVPDSKI